MATDSWNAETYKQFIDARTRPARDLLSAIPDFFQPNVIYDLGCGTGNSTILLKNRWPDANVAGIDSSFAMLNEAKKTYPNIQFIHGDIEEFSAPEKIDCLFANASLQWLENHEYLIPKLLKQMNSGGMVAIQMPNNFHSPSHQVTIEILQRHEKWQSLLKNLRYGILKKPLYHLSQYYDLFTKSGVESLQLWETEYFQEMTDYHEIFEWVKGTALRPILSAMEMNDQAKFKQEYISSISKAYPLQINNKILLPFKRIFMLGCIESC